MSRVVPISSPSFEVDVTAEALSGSFSVPPSSSVDVVGECTLALYGLVRPLQVGGSDQTNVSRTLVAIAEALGHLADYPAA